MSDDNQKGRCTIRGNIEAPIFHIFRDISLDVREHTHIHTTAHTYLQ